MEIKTIDGRKVMVDADYTLNSRYFVIVRTGNVPFQIEVDEKEYARLKRKKEK